MSTMRFADEVVPQSDIDRLALDAKARPDPKERKPAIQIIDSLATDWDPSRYHDTYTEDMRKLIERRFQGEQIQIEPAPATKSTVVVLMEALQGSSPRKTTSSRKSA